MVYKTLIRFWFHSERRTITLILALRLILSLWFLLHIPPWEKADEINHYQYIRFIVENGRLPTAADAPILPPELAIYIQYEQPPLYYLLNVPIAILFNNPTLPTPNAVPVGANPFLHYYLHDDPLPVALLFMRGLNILLGVLTTGLIWRAVRRFDTRLALAASALFAVYPPALELSAWVNNDTLLLVIGAAVLLIIPRPVSLASVVLVCGAAFTKLTGLAVLPALVWLTGSHLWRSKYRFVLLVLLVAAGMGFGLFNLARCNFILCRTYHTEALFKDLAALLKSLNPTLFFQAYTMLLRTASVSTISPNFPPVFPQVLIGTALLVTGFGGGLLALRRAAARPLLITCLWLLAGALALATLRVWWLQADYLHLRYLAVAVPALMVVLAYSYSTLHPHALPWALGLWLGLALLNPLINYAPVYVPPPMTMTLPPDCVPVADYRFESGVSLAGYCYDKSELTLYFSAEKPTTHPLFALVSIYDAAGNLVEQSGLTLGTALHPTTIWQAGMLVPQTFNVTSGVHVRAFSLDLFYLVNPNYITNYYDPRQPDARLAGGTLAIR